MVRCVMRVGGAVPSRRAHEEQEEAGRRQEEGQEEETRQDEGNRRSDETEGTERPVLVLRVY